MIGLAISGANILNGWVQAARAVASPHFDNDHVTIVADHEWNETPAALRQFDAIALEVGTERPSGVANVLCPRVLLTSAGTTEEKIVRAWDYLGRGRRMGLSYSGWRDTYFERLTGYHAAAPGSYKPIRENRLLSIIEKIKHWDHNIASSLYAHTDAASDRLRPRGSPCLQYVQFRVHDQTRVGVTGIYRSHDYLSKALGNLIGLQRLARFVAQETGRDVGRVAVISLVPIAEGGKGRLQRFVDAVAGIPGI
jgi:hypothetical protein